MPHAKPERVNLNHAKPERVNLNHAKPKKVNLNHAKPKRVNLNHANFIPKNIVKNIMLYHLAICFVSVNFKSFFSTFNIF